MADQYDWEDDDTDFEDAQGGGSNALKELRKANRAKEKQLRELQEQYQQMQRQLRERAVKDVLEARGLNPKIAKFVPSDITDAEQVSAWVEEYADVFSGQPQQQAPQQEASAPVTPPDAAALNRISATQTTGQPFSNDPDQLAGRILNAQSPEELNQILFGNTAGPNAY
jgi:hypothetical protein